MLNAAIIQMGAVRMSTDGYLWSERAMGIGCSVLVCCNEVILSRLDVLFRLHEKPRYLTREVRIKEVKAEKEHLIIN